MEKSEIKIIWYMSWFKGTFKISFKMISSLIWKGSQSNKTRGWSRSQKRDCYVFKAYTLLLYSWHTYCLYKVFTFSTDTEEERFCLFVFGGFFSLVLFLLFVCFCFFLLVFFCCCKNVTRKNFLYSSYDYIYIPSQKGITYFHTIYDRE